MTPLKVRIYEQLRTLYNQRLGYTATAELVSLTGGNYYRTYRALRNLEDAGVIHRKSPHSGWRPKPTTLAIYSTMLKCYRRSRNPITTEIISYHTNTHERIVRHHLRKLEGAGLAHRKSPRTGWLPVRHSPTPIIDQLVDTLITLYRRTQSTVPNIEIANALNVHPSYTRRTLVEYEQLGIVKRPSPRGGWLPISA